FSPYLLCHNYTPPARAPPSFPTRRSSDLAGGRQRRAVPDAGRQDHPLPRAQPEHLEGPRRIPVTIGRRDVDEAVAREGDDHLGRSEEHTSELQSPYDLVCRLLLEKKKHQQ